MKDFLTDAEMAAIKNKQANTPQLNFDGGFISDAQMEQMKAMNPTTVQSDRPRPLSPQEEKSVAYNYVQENPKASRFANAFYGVGSPYKDYVPEADSFFSQEGLIDFAGLMARDLPVMLLAGEATAPLKGFQAVKNIAGAVDNISKAGRFAQAAPKTALATSNIAKTILKEGATGAAFGTMTGHNPAEEGAAFAAWGLGFKGLGKVLGPGLRALGIMKAIDKTKGGQFFGEAMDTLHRDGEKAAIDQVAVFRAQGRINAKEEIAALNNIKEYKQMFESGKEREIFDRASEKFVAYAEGFGVGENDAYRMAKEVFDGKMNPDEAINFIKAINERGYDKELRVSILKDVSEGKLTPEEALTKYPSNYDNLVNQMREEEFFSLARTGTATENEIRGYWDDVVNGKITINDAIRAVQPKKGGPGEAPVIIGEQPQVQPIEPVGEISNVRSSIVYDAQGRPVGRKKGSSNLRPVDKPGILKTAEELIDARSKPKPDLMGKPEPGKIEPVGGGTGNVSRERVVYDAQGRPVNQAEPPAMKEQPKVEQPTVQPEPAAPKPRMKERIEAKRAKEQPVVEVLGNNDAMKIKEAADGWNNGTLQADDIARILDGVKDKDIRKAVDDYYKAVEDDALEWGMRSGEDLLYGDNLIDLVERKAAGIRIDGSGKVNPESIKKQSKPEGKELWKITLNEYKNDSGNLPERWHKNAVEKALAEGKPVPENVLKDYPELRAEMPLKRTETARTATQGEKAGVGKGEPENTFKSGDVITDGLVTGEVIGEGSVGKVSGYKVKIIGGREDGSTTIITPRDAKKVDGKSALDGGGKKSDVVNFLEGDLPKKLPKKNEKISIDSLKETGEINVKPIKQNIKPAKNKNDIMNIRDDARPILNHVLHDAENGVRIITDGNKLVSLADNTIKKSKVVDPVTGKQFAEASEYPDVGRVIYSHNKGFVAEIDGLIDDLAGLSRANKFIDDPYPLRNERNLIAVLDIDGNYHGFSPDVLGDALIGLRKHGIKKVRVESGKVEDGVLFRDLANDKNFALVMPLKLNNPKIAHKKILTGKTTNIEPVKVIKSKEELRSAATAEKKKQGDVFESGEKKPKEAWEMTRGDYMLAGGIKMKGRGATHRKAVEQALAEGKPVPKNVIDEYTSRGIKLGGASGGKSVDQLIREGKIPEMNLSNKTEDALDIGAKVKGNKGLIAKLYEKWQEFAGKARDKNAEFQERANNSHISQLYREAYEVATGEMPPRSTKFGGASGGRSAQQVIDLMEKQRVREKEMKSPVNPSNVKARYEKVKQELKTAISNRFQVVVDMQRTLEKNNNLKLNADDSPEVAMSLFNGIYGKVEKNLREIEEIFSKTGDVNAFRNYMELNKYIERASLDMKNPNNITAEEAFEALSKMRNENPSLYAKLEQGAKELKKFNDSMLDYYAESGMITTDTAELLKQKYQHYVPFRVLDYLEDGTGRFGSKTFNISREDLIKIQQGTDREVGDVLSAYMDKMQMMVNRAERNKAATKVADLAEKFKDDPNINDFIVEVKPGSNPGFGKDVFNVMRDGKRHTYAVDKEVAEAMKGMTENETDIITRFIGHSTRALRAGATMYNLSFSLPNVVRDYLNAKVINPYGLSVADWMHGFVSSVREAAGIKDDLYRAFLESGGAFSTFEKHFAPDVFLNRAQRRALGKKWTLNSFNPLEWVRLFNNSLEEATRVGVYRRTLRKAGSVNEAAFWARNATVDFNRMGSVVRVANVWVPFLNARIQGVRNIIKALNDRPVATGAKIASIIGVPAAVTYVWNRGFAEFDQIPDWERKKYFIIMTGKYTSSDGESRPTYVRIPKGDVGEVFGSIAENTMEYMLYSNPEGFYGFGKKLMGDFVGQSTESVMPISGNIAGSLTPAIKVLAEWGANYNFFREQPIVPDWLKNAAPEEQYNYRTSILAKKAGKAFNVSPLKIDNAIYGTFGGSSKYVLSVPNLWLADDKSRSQYEKLAGVPGIEAFLGKSGYGLLEKKYKKLEEFQEQSGTVYVKRFRAATEELEKYKKLSGGAKIKFKSELKKRDPKLYNTFSRMEKDDRLGMTKLEKNIKELEPKVRAEYIADILRGKQGGELKDTISDYKEKGIITDQVSEHLREIGFKVNNQTGGGRRSRRASRATRATRATRASRY